jgi:hypothetical protein
MIIFDLRKLKKMEKYHRISITQPITLASFKDDIAMSALMNEHIDRWALSDPAEPIKYRILNAESLYIPPNPKIASSEKVMLSVHIAYIDRYEKA